MDQPEHERTRQDEARDALRRELREAVGDEAAARAERRGALDAAVEHGGRPRAVAGVLRESRALLAVTLCVALVVGAVIAAITGAWWFVAVALLIHAVGTVVVVATTLSLATQAESPAPTTAAALEARGVADPDAALNEAVAAADEDPGRTDRAEPERGSNRVAGSGR